MRTLLLALLLPSFLFPQTSNDPPVKLKNWRERLYRSYRVEDVEAAQKRLASVRDSLDRFRSLPATSYPEVLKEQEVLVARYQTELKTAEAELAKVDEMLTNPETRKAFNKEAEKLFRQRNAAIAATAGKSSSTAYRSFRHFRIDCYSGGYRRHFWVRCTSSSY